MKKFLIIIFLLSTIAAAQNYKFGFDFGLQQVRTENNHILSSDADIYSVHLGAAYKFSDIIFLRFQAGRSFQTEFTGEELGLNCSYTFFHPLYLSGGIFLHLNEGTDIGLVRRTNGATLFMFTMGLGVEVTQVFSIDINYFLPASHQVIGYGNNIDHEIRFYQDKFYSMVRLSFNLAWEL